MTDRFEQGYALIVGVTESQVTDWALPEVAKDISALKNVLIHPSRCAYPPEHIKVLTGTEATRNGILDGLEWLQDRLANDGSGNTTAVVYFTGHGWHDTAPNFYLIPYDVKESKVQSRSLRAEDFAAAIDELAPRRLLVILDCCHAGGMGVKGKKVPQGYIATAMPPALLMSEKKGVSGVKGLRTLAHGRGRAVLSSSTDKQRSHVRPDKKMSIFTFHLIEALTGHAQPEGGATEVLVSDVMSYVTRKVPASAQALGTEQTPDFQISGNFPVALLLGGKGLSKGQSAPDPLEPLSETLESASHHAVANGSGAIAQGPGAVAAGERGVAIGGNVHSSIIITGNNSTAKEDKN